MVVGNLVENRMNVFFRGIVLFLALMSIYSPSPASSLSGVDNKISCGSNVAEYVPKSTVNVEGKEYFVSLVVRLNPDYNPKKNNFDPNTIPVSFFQLRITDSKSKKLTTTFDMDLYYSGGAVTAKTLFLSSKKQMDVVFLDKNFSAVNLSEDGLPYSIVLPNVVSHFYKIPSHAHGQYDELIPNENVRFYTEEMFFPYLGMQEVWIFKKCLNGG